MGTGTLECDIQNQKIQLFRSFRDKESERTNDDSLYKTAFTKAIGGDFIYVTYQITYPKDQKDRYDSYCKMINERLK